MEGTEFQVAEPNATELCACGQCKDVVIAVIGSCLFWFAFYNLILVTIGQYVDSDWAVRIVTGIHGMISAFMCFVSVFIFGPWPFTYIGYPPTEFHCNIIIFSCGYFIFDLLWCLYMNTEGIMMLFHHILSLYGFLYILMYNSYGCEFIAVLGASEATNPILQFRWFIKHVGFYHGFLAKFVDFTFVSLFIGLRLVVGSVLLIWLCLSPRMSLIPKLGGIGIYGISIVFSLHLLVFIHRKYISQKQKKED